MVLTLTAVQVAPTHISTHGLSLIRLLLCKATNDPEWFDFVLHPVKWEQKKANDGLWF